MHGDALHVISSLGIWRIKDDGRRLVPDMLKPLLWEGQKVEACCPWSIFQCPLTQRSFQHGRISLALSLNKNQVHFSHSARFCIASSSTPSICSFCSFCFCVPQQLEPVAPILLASSCWCLTPMMGELFGSCPLVRPPLSVSPAHGNTLHSSFSSVLTHFSSVLRDSIYFTTASAKQGSVAWHNDFNAPEFKKLLTMLRRALWRCGFDVSQRAIAPQQVLTFKVPAVCIAAWSEPAFYAFQQSASSNVSAFVSSARDVVAVGAADGSVHLISPNRWRRHICRLAPHSLYAAMCPQAVQSAICLIRDG